MQKHDVEIVVVSKMETTTVSKLVVAENATTTDVIWRTSHRTTEQGAIL